MNITLVQIRNSFGFHFLESSDYLGIRLVYKNHTRGFTREYVNDILNTQD